MEISFFGIKALKRALRYKIVIVITKAQFLAVMNDRKLSVTIGWSLIIMPIAQVSSTLLFLFCLVMNNVPGNLFPNHALLVRPN